ncbi:MAG: hypothetical protein EA359_06085 [Balneolaceae bacterium]|nr:MAG: hypothetical protein EA359_06085 [Balneolaceae bacterium]
MIRICCCLIIAVILSLQPEMLKGQQPENPDVFLIAHRGGVVDEDHAENSRAAMLSAIERGYWMLEVDIRETRDGRAILHHDADFLRFYNDPRRVEEMDWNEIKQLRSYIDGDRPILFSEAAELAAGRTKLMLDVKGNDLSEGFYREIEEALIRHGLVETTYILSSAQAKEYFYDRTSHSIGFNGMVEAANAGEDVSGRYHLFMLASQLTEEMIKKADELNVVVVAAVNEFRYVQAGQDTWEGAKQDVERLLSLGVQYYQIDSVYEPLFK